ncbi:MAG: ribonuclease P protein component [Kineosporiaceae bacterium]|nr:ribonuclease P protein component [Kineosporiaceae bacterium]
MLPAGHRMRRPSEFSGAMRSGHRAGRRTLVVHMCCPQPGDGGLTAASKPLIPAHVGFIVSRAVGGAVVRNRVKRRLRAQVEARLGRLDDGCLVVVRALPAAASATSDELAHDLAGALDAVTRRIGRATGSRTSPLMTPSTEATP